MAENNYWLVKQEPEAYPWSQLVADKVTDWTGVRNYQARNNLRQMKKGDLVLFYHSVKSKEVVGLAKVKKTAYPDPTAKEGDWSAVDIVPVKSLKEPVSLAQMKADERFDGLSLIRNSRLSVMPVSKKHFDLILKLGGVH